jgi:hypothetical protein
MDDWHSAIEAESTLTPAASRSLHDAGFVVMSGPVGTDGLLALSEAYDHAIATADPADIRISSSTRVEDFVNRGPAFDGLYLYEPLLAACCEIIGRPFKLSGMRARTLEPGAATEGLHVDVKHRADGWPLVGFILMVDPFDADNGATRFVPGSQRQSREPGEVLNDLNATHPDQTLACGPAGSMIIFNASTWHSHTANQSTRRRRSIQGHFVPRDARASTDFTGRMSAGTFRRIGDRARYVLSVERSLTGNEAGSP